MDKSISPHLNQPASVATVKRVFICSLGIMAEEGKERRKRGRKGGCYLLFN